MKKQLLTILALGLGLFSQAQTVSTLPATTVPYGTQTRIQRSTGDIYVGSAALKFRALAQKKYTDSLLALKQNVLGFTPYNATNPAGYITQAQARTSVDFTPGSAAYNNTTGVFSIPTNTGHLVNGSGFITLAAARAGLSLTNTGTNGASTYNSTTGALNIPNYTLSGLGGQPQLNGTGFVKSDGTTISYDNSTYLTGITGTQVTSALGYTPYDATNPSGYITSSSLSGYVPTTRTLTINGTTLDLSADRSFTVSANTDPLEFNTTDRTVWNNGKENIGSNTSFGQFSLSSNTTGVNNSFFGQYAGTSNTTGYFNSFFGNSAGRSNTTGYFNSFFGSSAGRSNTTGLFNSFFGQDAGYSNTTGWYNSFFGQDAGRSNTTGNSNSFFGQYAGTSNTTGYNNSFFGERAGYYNTTGDSNSFFGKNAGTGTANNLIPNNTISFQSIFIGFNTKALDNNQTNQIVIGNSAIGAGSNTATLGNTSITLTRLRGQVNMGSIKLDAMNTAPASATATGTVGEIRVTATHIYVCTATDTWVRTALATW